MVIAFIEGILGLLEDVDLDFTFSNSIAYSDVQIFLRQQVKESSEVI